MAPKFQAENDPREAGSPKRRSRKRSPSDERRKARRAVARALATSSEIQGASRARQGASLSSEANKATSLTTDLENLYGEFTDDKRGIFKTGLVPNGTPFRGRTWKPR